MNGNRLYQQMIAIFSLFMVFFYLGIGIYLIFYSGLNYMDKALQVMMGGTLLLYGSYRAYRAYVSIVKVFFRKEDDEE